MEEDRMIEITLPITLTTTVRIRLTRQGPVVEDVDIAVTDSPAPRPAVADMSH